MSEVTRVLIADDEPEVLANLRQSLERSSRLRVVAEAHDGLEAWDCLQQFRPDIAILDIGMAQMDGVALVRRIRRQKLPVDVIFLTVCDERRVFDTALELGVKGYLLKHYTGDEILTCVEAVAHGEHCASPPVVTHILRRSQPAAPRRTDAKILDSLTTQETAILRRIRQHKSSKEIATEMGISVRTVDTHRASICKKLGIHGNYGLNRYATGDDS